MFAEQYLSQIKTLRYQISCKQRDAEMWRSVAESLQSFTEGERVQKSSSQDKMADAIAKAVDCETDAKAIALCLIDLQKTIMWQIDNLDLAQHRVVLSEYYVHGMTLAEIANEWHRSYRHVKRVKSDAIHAFANKYRGMF